MEDKLYYTIGEAAEILGENVSLVRFWSDSFPQFIKPRRTLNKNNRTYTKEDIATLKSLHYLIKGQGLTLEGAARRMASGKSEIDARAEAVSRLKAVKARLEAVLKGLDDSEDES